MDTTIWSQSENITSFQIICIRFIENILKYIHIFAFVFQVSSLGEF